MDIRNKIIKIKESFFIDKKLNLIIDILDDYIVFDDNWISEHDEFVYDTNRKKHEILDFKEVELKNKHKHSCIKINRITNIGEIFYL